MFSPFLLKIAHSLFIDFNYVHFGVFLKFSRNREIQVLADLRSPPLGNHHVINTSNYVITSHCGPQGKHLWTYYLFSKFHCGKRGAGQYPSLSPPSSLRSVERYCILSLCFLHIKFKAGNPGSCRIESR